MRKRLPGTKHIFIEPGIWCIFQHFYGRRRNCYTIAIRAAQKMLQRAAKNRHQKKVNMKAVSMKNL